MLGVNPEEVYISNSRRGGYAYHTSLDCPDLPPATRTLAPSDEGYEQIVDKRDECQWCRYDTLELDLPDEED